MTDKFKRAEAYEWWSSWCRRHPEKLEAMQIICIHRKRLVVVKKGRTR